MAGLTEIPGFKTERFFSQFGKRPSPDSSIESEDDSTRMPVIFDADLANQPYTVSIDSEMCADLLNVWNVKRRNITKIGLAVSHGDPDNPHFAYNPADEKIHFELGMSWKIYQDVLSHIDEKALSKSAPGMRLIWGDPMSEHFSRSIQELIFTRGLPYELSVSREFIQQYLLRQTDLLLSRVMIHELKHVADMYNNVAAMVIPAFGYLVCTESKANDAAMRMTDMFPELRTLVSLKPNDFQEV